MSAGSLSRPNEFVEKREKQKEQQEAQPNFNTLDLLKEAQLSARAGVTGAVDGLLKNGQMDIPDISKVLESMKAGQSDSKNSSRDRTSNRKMAETRDGGRAEPEGNERDPFIVHEEEPLNRIDDIQTTPEPEWQDPDLADDLRRYIEEQPPSDFDPSGIEGGRLRDWTEDGGELFDDEGNPLGDNRTGEDGEPNEMYPDYEEAEEQDDLPEAEQNEEMHESGEPNERTVPIDMKAEEYADAAEMDRVGGGVDAPTDDTQEGSAGDASDRAARQKESVERQKEKARKLLEEIKRKLEDQRNAEREELGA